MGAYRNVALSELNLRGISINAEAGNTTSISVVASDSGVMFINYETGGDVTYHLPAVADAAGKMFWFYDTVATNNIIITAPTNTMMNVNAAINTTITGANAAGQNVIILCDGATYYAMEFSGVWIST